jgi:Protein of unknown function (DUF4238)
MASALHHYVPRFMLARFVPEGEKHLYEMDKVTGETHRCVPEKAACIRSYYRLEQTDLLSEDPEVSLERLETAASTIIARLLDDGVMPGEEDRFVLGMFLWVLNERGPLAQGRILTSHAIAARASLIEMLRYPDHFQSIAAEIGVEGTVQEIESERQTLLRLLRDEGAVEISYPKDYSILGVMAFALEGAIMLSELGWEVREAGTEGEFVIGDTPVTMYDPSPKNPESGSAWMSSSNAVTLIPLSPSTCLALSPSHERMTARPDGRAAVDHANLRSYAWAGRWVYAQSEHVLGGLADLAAAKPEECARLAYRPPSLLMVHPEGSPDDGPDSQRYDTPETRRSR